MSTTTLTLLGNKNFRVKYRAPRDGRIEYEVESENPVDSLVVDDYGLKQLDNGSPDNEIQYFGRFIHDKTRHHQEIVLPFRSGHWWLVVRNDHRQPTAVHFDVYS